MVVPCSNTWIISFTPFNCIYRCLFKWHFLVPTSSVIDTTSEGLSALFLHDTVKIARPKLWPSANNIAENQQKYLPLAKNVFAETKHTYLLQRVYMTSIYLFTSFYSFLMRSYDEFNKLKSYGEKLKNAVEMSATDGQNNL